MGCFPGSAAGKEAQHVPEKGRLASAAPAWHSVAPAAVHESRSELDTGSEVKKGKKKKKPKRKGVDGSARSEKEKSEVSKRKRKGKKKGTESERAKGGQTEDCPTPEESQPEKQEVQASAPPEPDPPAKQEEASPQAAAEAKVQSPSAPVQSPRRESVSTPASSGRAALPEKKPPKQKRLAMPLDYEPLSSRKIGKINSWVESLPRTGLLDPVEFVKQRYGYRHAKTSGEARSDAPSQKAPNGAPPATTDS
eukprot:TRINITY_DN12096_c0_g1_i2.p1 TRINITY_DN12096_c0_g1~~TRINITY_DN12096_c0_g1_i2.p1  ORF type:complete len:251 (+),score=73.93 TRINITY_DN12096_c0_g1_i2:122-874(+)